jgi:hypothetical protein
MFMSTYVLEGEKSGLGPEGAFASRIMEFVFAGDPATYKETDPPRAQSDQGLSARVDYIIS